MTVFLVMIAFTLGMAGICISLSRGGTELMYSSVEKLAASADAKTLNLDADDPPENLS